MIGKSQAVELVEIAQRIRDRQLALDVSDEKWVKEHRDLGSSKTYKNIIAGNLAGYDAERWLVSYRSAWNLIEAEMEASQGRDPIYDDLSTVTRLRVAVIDAMASKSNDRLVILQGPSGAGKTEALRLIAGKYGKRVLMLEANETWKDNVTALLNAILEKLEETAPASAADRMARVIKALAPSRVMIVIDEAHHLGPRQLNLIKSIINQTPGEVVLAALDTLWDKLESMAYAESRQLIHNRLSERVQITAPDKDDVEKILTRRLGINGADGKKAAEMVRKVAQVKGSLKFVTRVCRRSLLVSGGETPSLEDIAKAVGMVSQTMGVRS